MNVDLGMFAALEPRQPTEDTAKFAGHFHGRGRFRTTSQSDVIAKRKAKAKRRAKKGYKP